MEQWLDGHLCLSLSLVFLICQMHEGVAGIKWNSWCNWSQVYTGIQFKNCQSLNWLMLATHSLSVSASCPDPGYTILSLLLILQTSQHCNIGHFKTSLRYQMSLPIETHWHLGLMPSLLTHLLCPALSHKNINLTVQVFNIFSFQIIWKAQKSVQKKYHEILHLEKI